MIGNQEQKGGDGVARTGNLIVHEERIREFCKRNKIRKLFLFVISSLSYCLGSTGAYLIPSPSLASLSLLS